MVIDSSRDFTKISPITTTHLILVPTSLRDVEDIFKEFTKSITTYMKPDPYDSIDEVKKDIINRSKNMQQGEELAVDILNKDKIFLGRGFITHIKDDNPELGIWIKQSAHGHAYGREAIQALMNWADDTISYTYLKYPVDRKNIASKKIPEFLGGKIGLEYKKVTESGKILDVTEYRFYKK